MTYIGFFEQYKCEISTNTKVINFATINPNFFDTWYKLLFTATNRISTKLGVCNPSSLHHGKTCFDCKIDYEILQTLQWYKQTLQKEFSQYLITGLRKEPNTYEVQAFYVAYKTLKNYE